MSSHAAPAVAGIPTTPRSFWMPLAWVQDGKAVVYWSGTQTVVFMCAFLALINGLLRRNAGTMDWLAAIVSVAGICVCARFALGARQALKSPLRGPAPAQATAKGGVLGFLQRGAMALGGTSRWRRWSSGLGAAFFIVIALCELLASGSELPKRCFGAAAYGAMAFMLILNSLGSPLPPSAPAPALTWRQHAMRILAGIVVLSLFMLPVELLKGSFHLTPAKSPVLTVTDSSPAAAAVRSPREVVAEWLRRVKANNRRTQDPFDLTTRESSVTYGQDFTDLQNFDSIRPLHQLGNSEQVLVVSNQFENNAGEANVFYAALVRRQGRWLITRQTHCSPDEASGTMTGFSLTPGMKCDVIAAELVGEWRAACDSRITMAADGTGTQLAIGPMGPEPGVKPEPFKWDVSGAKLHFRFADRQEELEITWIDDDCVQFRSPNKTKNGWQVWSHERKNAGKEDPQIELPAEQHKRLPTIMDMAIMPRILDEVGRQLREMGATYDDLQVMTDEKEWTHRVVYRGLRNFKYTLGVVSGADGSFPMKSINSYQSQGSLGNKTFTVQYAKTDNIDLPFVNDPQAVGEWECVNIVAKQDDFAPGAQAGPHELSLKRLTLLEGGKPKRSITWPNFSSWTKGILINLENKSACHYDLREIKGQLYMFLELKNGDVMILGRDPSYYVLRKQPEAVAPARKP
jgi:hypothetical protein